MPLVVTQKSAKLPSYVDAPVAANTRDDYAIARKYQAPFSRAFMSLARSLFDAPTQDRVRKALRDPNRTVDSVFEEFEWLDLSDPSNSKKWELYSESMRRLYTKIMNEAGNAEYKKYGISGKITFAVQKAGVDGGIAPVPLNPFSKKWIDQHLGDWIVEINNDQQGIVRGILDEAINGGVRNDEIMLELGNAVGLTKREVGWVQKRYEKILEETGSKVLAKKGREEYFQKTLLERGRRIARTESKDAQSQGQMDSWQLAQEQGEFPQNTLKDWESVGESPRLSKICRELGEQPPIPLNASFQSSYVGPISRPPAHPNCRSVLTLIFPDDDEE